MGWMDLLSAAQTANASQKGLGEDRRPVPEQKYGGVGPWAYQQGQPAKSFLDRYLLAEGAAPPVRAWQVRRPQAPAPQDPVPADTRVSTSPVTQSLLGDRGNKREGEALDAGLEFSAKAADQVNTLHSLQTARNAQVVQAYRGAGDAGSLTNSATNIGNTAQTFGNTARLTDQASRVKQAAEVAASARAAAETAKAAKATADAAATGSTLAGTVEAVDWSAGWEAAVVIQILNASAQGAGAVKQFKATPRDKRQKGDTKETAFHRGVYESDPLAKVYPKFVKEEDRVTRDVSKLLKKVF